MLTVYKASAGSGKTFQLVIEYLKIILENPYNYKHILAVTFTNKATNEMKSRILQQLHTLASNQKSDYITPLQQGNNYTEQFIRQRAKEVLKNILHDYNRFSINTIDSFTQKVIKSFNRELGISPNFSVELDNEIILEESVDRLLSKIGENKNLLKWLKEFSREKIENNRSQRIDDDIKNLGKELFKESFQVFFPDDGNSMYNRENLDEFGKELRQIKNDFESALKKKAGTLFNLIIQNGFTIDDFSYKKSGVAGYIQNLANGIIKEPGARVLTAIEEVEKWYSAKHKSAAEIHSLVNQQLQPGLSEINQHFIENFERYNTALAVLRQLRMLGILTDLKEEIQVLLKEKGLLQLSDSNLLLSKIIGQTDSPFVYEKIGSFYKHFMLDEFQDTSGLQWNNFKPLLINSLAEGNANLIVGDVKQSIYRWRNSDWNILAEQLDNDFSPDQKTDHSLEQNWRSDKNIIQFNNAIFGGLIETFESYLFSGFNNDKYLKKLKNIYESYSQEPGKKNAKPSGYIEANFLPKEEFEENSIQKLVDQVKQLQDSGIRAEEIVILIRKNKEGTDIIENFLSAAKLPENKKYNLSVLSNESLFLHASKGVLFTIHCIEYLVDPENEITKASLLQLWLGWLKPALQKLGISNQAQNGQNLLDFTDYSNWNLDQNLSTTFEEELFDRLQEARHKVLLSSLDETLTHLSSLFNLFQIETELPFVQTLIDKAGELKTSLSNDLSNFLLWWNEKGFRTSVSVNDQVSSIRLLTVHKSKGLEFKAVLIPFLNWDTSWSGTNAPMLWCQPQSAPFNKFPLLPIQAGSNMEASEFAPVYFDEKVNYIIDTLNLIYVAFTRAESILMVNCPAIAESRNKKPGSGKPAHYLFHKALQNLCDREPFADCFDEDNLYFKYGIISKSKDKIEANNSTLLKKYQFKDYSSKIKLRLSGENFLQKGEKQQSEKNKGKLIHEILSDIVSTDDINSACEKAFSEGRINKDELEDIRQIITENLHLEAVKAWFNGSFHILNERDLISNQQLMRPDRIMYNNNTAIVVDYKTGEINQEKYNRQVRQYAETLKNTGFEKVEGYLWYLNQNEIIKVCEI